MQASAEDTNQFNLPLLLAVVVDRNVYTNEGSTRLLISKGFSKNQKIGESPRRLFPPTIDAQERMCALLFARSSTS